MKNVNLMRFPRKLTSICNPIKVSKNLFWRYNSSISTESHVFVIGAPRSGTSLMFSILACHPVFSRINCETFFFVPRDVLNQKNYIRLYDFGGLKNSEVKELLDISKNLIDFYDRFTYAIKQRDNKQRFIEKTPFHVLYLDFLLKHFPNAKFINMIRDGRDCYISNKKLAPHFHQPIAKFSTIWRDSIKIRRNIGISKQILDIRYEELTDNPNQVTANIMNFLGEDFLEKQVDCRYFSQVKMFRGQSGHERLEKPIRPTSIGQWKKKMTREEISIFNRIASRELLVLGYEIN